MIESVGDHSVQVLLRVAVRIFEDAVVHAHREGGDVAGGRDNFDTRIKRSDQCRLKSTAAGSGDVDAFRIDIRSCEQIIDGANPIPNFPTSKIRSRQIRQVSQNRVLGANQVVAAFVVFFIPELATFALTKRVPRNDYIPALHQTLAERLVIRFSVCRMAARDKHRRMFACSIGRVHQSRNIYSRQAFKYQFLDMESLHLDSAGHASIQRSLFGW